MSRFPKPVEGSWTRHYPELGTAPVSYEDSISSEFYELEREAIFKRAWLNVGRVEQLPRNGSYFTKELAVANTSVVVVRGLDGEVRAFHNICRHRGNKLVWTDYPREETSGSARQFVCKYHGWKYELDGSCAFVQQESEFFDLDRADFGLVPVHCEVWAGFIFVNLDREPQQSLVDFLGPMITALESYPFHLLTERFTYTAEVPANWKVFLDTLQEQYHAPIVHRNQRPETFDAPMQVHGFEAPHYQLSGPHRMLTTPGILPWNLPADQLKKMEIQMRSGLFGPWDAPELGDLPAGVNPGNCDPWGISLFFLFPNFGIQFWERGWYHTYHHWPTSPSTHKFEVTLHFVPSRNARERVARQMAAASFREFAIQDDNLVAAQQSMLESRVVDGFPLGDQEVLCRHLHTVVANWVDDYRHEHANA
jgi:phenylpropionate dioxygenase-like ring-hydroxylating dioxygenase large terminal subunit